MIAQSTRVINSKGCLNNVVIIPINAPIGIHFNLSKRKLISHWTLSSVLFVASLALLKANSNILRMFELNNDDSTIGAATKTISLLLLYNHIIYIPFFTNDIITNEVWLIFQHLSKHFLSFYLLVDAKYQSKMH